MEPMNTPRPKAEYHCPQKDLYTIVKLGWANYDSHLADFSLFKTTYDAQLAIDQRAALVAARLLPDETTRADIHKSLRLEMLPMGLECVELWSNMSSYIRDAFPEDQYATKRLAAGSDYYEAAMNEDWESLSELMSKGLKFAGDHSAVLAASGGMPATFIPSMTVAAAAFDVKLELFLNAEETARVQTDAKIEANNALYRALLKMFEDGKKIFRKQPAVREQFVFETLMELVGKTISPDGKIRVSGNVSVAGSGQPVMDAVLQSGEGDAMVTTRTNGLGNYILETEDVEEERIVPVSVSFAGLIPQMVMVTLRPGEDVVLNFSLSPVVPVATITISGTLTNGMTSTPIASGNLAVVVGADSYTATSNAAGFFARTVPAPAVPTAATMTAAATGFIGQSRALTLAPGVDQTQNFGLMPLPMPPTP